MRSPLLVPCDDPAALAAALASGAGALVFDLGDPAAPGDRVARRSAVAGLLAHRAATPHVTLRLVRIAPLASGLADGDLDTVMAGAPDAILLPGAVGAIDIQHLAAKLAVREAEHGLAAGGTGIVATAADTARGVLALSTVPGASPRLRALAWDAAALAADLGTRVDAEPCRFAHALLLTAATAAGIPTIRIHPAGPSASDGTVAGALLHTMGD